MIYIKSCPVANRHGRKIMFRREQEENKMELCYDGALMLTSSYAVMDEEEMCYTEGGIAVTTVATIVGTVITIYGATYAGGTVCGKRLYHAGINTAKKWSKWKWQTRAIVIGTASRMGLAGTIAGTVFMLGLENQLYDMM